MELEVFLGGMLLGFSAIMLAASAVAYRRVRSPRLLFIALAFLVFAVKAIVVLVAAVLPDLWETFGVPPAILAFDLAVLVLLYLAVARR